LISLPPIALFGIDDVLSGRYLEGSLTFFQGVLFASLFIWGLLRKSMAFLRMGVFMFVLFLVYLVYMGKGHGFGSLWAFTFPLASFYLLDKQESIVWTGLLLISVSAIMFFHQNLEAYGYNIEFAVRFAASFLLVSIMAFSYAYLRDELHERMGRELEANRLLMKEIHHRVNNNLSLVQSLLSLQCSRVEDDASRSVLLESESRVMSISLLHDVLYRFGDSSKVDMSRYLGRVVNNVVKTYDGDMDRIAVNIEMENILLDVEQAMPCGLILNELVTNAIKHSPPGEPVRVDVSLAGPSEDECVLLVGNNAEISPEGLDKDGSGSFGMKLVRSFADQLKGELHEHSSHGRTEFRLRFRKADLTE
jgi:two-component sensor histidine kinase